MQIFAAFAATTAVIVNILDVDTAENDDGNSGLDIVDADNNSACSGSSFGDIFLQLTALKEF